jgi:hypothetical protein
MEVMGYINLAQDREGFRAVVNMVMNFPILSDAGGFLNKLRACYLFTQDSALWNLCVCVFVSVHTSFRSLSCDMSLASSKMRSSHSAI